MPGDNKQKADSMYPGQSPRYSIGKRIHVSALVFRSTDLTRANFPSNPSPLINSSAWKGELTAATILFPRKFLPSRYTRFESRSRTPWNSRVTFDGNFVFTRKIRYSPIESYNVTVSIKRKDRVTWRLTAIMDRIFSPIVSSPPLFPFPFSFFSFFSFHSMEESTLHVFQPGIGNRTDFLRCWYFFPSEIRGFLTFTRAANPIVSITVTQLC